MFAQRVMKGKMWRWGGGRKNVFCSGIVKKEIGEVEDDLADEKT